MIKRLLILIIFISTLANLLAQTISSTDTTQSYSIKATFYSDRFIGRKTSSGEVFKQDKFTAAHKYLKFGTLVLVTNPENGKQVIVKINDRCPKGGILDMTKRAAKSIEISSKNVTIQILPERYHSYWENQNSYENLLQGGTFLSQTGGRTATMESKTATTQGSKSNSTNSQIPQAPLKGKTEAPKEPLYNLELCIVSIQSETAVVIEKIPIHYRNRVQEIVQGDEFHIQLNLAMKLEELKDIQADLYTLFPRSKPIKISPKE